MEKEEYNFILKIENSSLVKFVKCYLWESLYVSLILIVCLIYRDNIFSDAAKLGILVGFLPIPIAVIRYIKEIDLKNKLDLIEENVLFSKDVLNDEKMARFRKLIFKSSIIKNSWNTKQFINSVINSLVGLLYSDFQNEEKKTDPSYEVVKERIIKIDQQIDGFKNSLGKEYDIEYIIKKYFEYINAEFKMKFDSNASKSIFEKIASTNNNQLKENFKNIDFNLKRYFDCEFDINEENQKVIDKIPNELFEQYFINCNYLNSNSENTETENFSSENTNYEENILTEDQHSKIIRKKSRDYRVENGTIEDYIAQTWYIIRDIDYAQKYKSVEFIEFEIKSNPRYIIKFTKKQMDSLIDYKYPDNKGNYHFYFWIREEKNQKILIDARSGLNKKYLLIHEKDVDGINYFGVREKNDITRIG